MHQSPNRRLFQFPASYESRIEELLSRIGYSLREPKALAEAVLRLSDHYTGSPEAPSPWTETWAQAASLAYYFPLNHSRASAVAIEAKRLGFFNGLDHYTDFGSGMGSALHAVRDVMALTEAQDTSTDWTAIDVSTHALSLGHHLAAPGRTHRSRNVDDHCASPDFAKSLLIASYVLTELPDLPSSCLKHEALMIIEPSTSSDGRRLMAYRNELLASGYKMWAPCTHQKACPLLVESKKDWCHDRIHFEVPAWMAAIESRLPMRNRTLTFSYLLARKMNTTPPAEQVGLARLTGDTLEEKGKHRQSVCRGSEREFLAWFPPRLGRDQTIELQRGNLVHLSDGLEKRSNEVRLKSKEAVRELPPDKTI